MNTADVSCLYKEHIVFERVSTWICEYTVLHHDVHEPRKTDITVMYIELIYNREYSLYPVKKAALKL